MKVLHISVRADVGGGPRHILYLLKGTADAVENYVAAPSGFAYSNALHGFSVEFISIPHRRFSLTSLIRLVFFIRRSDIDLIHSHGRGGGIYSRFLGVLLRVPVVHTHHGLYLENYSGIKKCFLVLLERFLNTITKKIVFVSPSERRACQESGACRLDKSVVIPNGIDVPPHISRTVHNGPLRLLAITRLDKEENNGCLIKLIQACEHAGVNVRLRIAGDGPERQILEELARELQVGHLVAFLGNCTNVNELINESDIYVTSSLGEGHSIAMIEAMAGGLAVVATDVRGHNDVVENGVNGYLFSIGDFDKAVSIINKFSLNRQHMIRCGEKGRSLVEMHYSHEQMVSRVFSLYRSLICS